MAENADSTIKLNSTLKMETDEINFSAPQFQTIRGQKRKADNDLQTPKKHIKVKEDKEDSDSDFYEMPETNNNNIPYTKKAISCSSDSDYSDHEVYVSSEEEYLSEIRLTVEEYEASLQQMWNDWNLGSPRYDKASPSSSTNNSP